MASQSIGTSLFCLIYGIPSSLSLLCHLAFRVLGVRSLRALELTQRKIQVVLKLKDVSTCCPPPPDLCIFTCKHFGVLLQFYHVVVVRR